MPDPSRSSLLPAQLLQRTIAALREALHCMEELASLEGSGHGQPGQPRSARCRTAVTVPLFSGDGAAVPSATQARRKLQQRMIRGGERAATILLYMLERPGVIISSEELAEICRIRSQSTNVIKVYICHIRSTFAFHGLSKALIHSSRAGYALQFEAVEYLIQWIGK